MSDPSLRRVALGDELRRLRDSRDLSGKQLAGVLGWQPSKISRIESAKQGLKDGDLVAIAVALDLSSEETEALRSELRSVRAEEARWAHSLRVGHRAVQERVRRDERSATRICSFSLNLIPGTAQTARYAWHVFDSLADFADSPRDTDQAVAARMDRQSILYSGEKQIEILVHEFALVNLVAPVEVLYAQIDRLMTIVDVPTRFGIVPFGRPMPAGARHSFVIKDDVVAVELINTEIVTEEPGDVALYRSYLDALWAQAAEGDQARALLLAAQQQLGANR